MATVFTTVLRADLTPYVGEVMFRPVRAPRARTADVIAGDDIRVEVGASGFVSTPLAGGRYMVFIGRDRWEILVPADDSAYLLQDLRYDPASDGRFVPVPTDPGAVGFNYRVSDGVLQLINGTTGQWHSIWLSETPDPATITLGAPNVPGDAVNHRIDSGSFQLRNVDTGAWHSVYVSGDSPDFVLAVAEEQNPVGGNYRYVNQRLQIFNPDTALWHTIYVTGAGNAIHLAIGPSEP